MKSKRTFYRTVVTVEVLSEAPLSPNLSLADLDYAITNGDCSGIVNHGKPKKLTAPQAARALKKQGSDPTFFRLTAKGEELKDY